MKTRLAMVACYGPHEGPWLRARGNETGVKVTCLGEGESVIMSAQDRDLSIKKSTYVEAGTFPLPGGFLRVSFEKVGSKFPTSVELVVA